jgi:hypothetical protein
LEGKVTFAPGTRTTHVAITTLAQLPSGPGSKPANAGDQFKQILAYVPTEAVTMYVGLSALVTDRIKDTTQQNTFSLWIFWIGLVTAAALVFVANKQSTTKRPMRSLLWRAFAAATGFFVWTLALGNYTPLQALYQSPELLKTVGAAGVIFVPVAFQILGVFIEDNASADSGS